MEFELEDLYISLQSDNSILLGNLLNSGLQLDMKIPDPKKNLPSFLQNEPPLLSAASYYCARNCFKLIAERYQQFFISDSIGNPLTYFTILGGDCDLIDLLKGFGLEFEKCLPFAAKNKKSSVFRFICQIQDIPFDIDIFDNEKNSSVHYAAFNGDLELLKFLHQNGSNLTLKNGEGMSPICIASKEGYSDIVKFLTTIKNVNINESDNTNVFFILLQLLYYGLLQMVMFNV